jgi:hypothetical protein
MYVLIREYVDVRINLKSLYTILKNMYILFEKYGASIGMNGDGRTSVDRRGRMDGC